MCIQKMAARGRPGVVAAVHGDTLGARRELRGVLERRFPESRRVQLKAFYLDRDADENAETIISYALKRTAPLILDGGREEPWPVEWELASMSGCTA